MRFGRASAAADWRSCVLRLGPDHRAPRGAQRRTLVMGASSIRFAAALALAVGVVSLVNDHAVSETAAPAGTVVLPDINVTDTRLVKGAGRGTRGKARGPVTRPQA